MKVAEVMTKDVRSVGPDASLADATRIMWEIDCGFIPVAEPQSRALIGVVTDRDACIASMTQGAPLHAIPVELPMSRAVVTCQPEDDLAVAHDLMRRHQLHRLAVADPENRLVGVLSINDIARQAARLRGNERAAALTAVAETLAAICKLRESAAAASAGR